MREGKSVLFPLQHSGADDPWSCSSCSGGGSGEGAGTSCSAALDSVKLYTYLQDAETGKPPFAGDLPQRRSTLIEMSHVC